MSASVNSSFLFLLSSARISRIVELRLPGVKQSTTSRPVAESKLFVPGSAGLSGSKAKCAMHSMSAVAIVTVRGFTGVPSTSGSTYVPSTSQPVKLHPCDGYAWISFVSPSLRRKYLSVVLPAKEGVEYTFTQW